VIRQVKFKNKSMNNITAAPGMPTKQNNVLKVIGIALGLFVLAVAGIIYMVFQLGSAPIKAGGEFLEKLSTGKTSEAYQSASLQFKQSVSEEDFQLFLESYPVLTRVQDTSFNSFQIENKFASISGIITATDGQVSPVTIQLVDENNGWKVLNIDLNPPTSSPNSDDLETDF